MKTTITTIALVLIATTTSFASLASSSGSFGGGYGVVLPTEPQISGEINQSMNFNGFHADLYASNESAWLHSWTDDETGQTYSHVHPQQSSGSFSFQIDQGFMGYNYLPGRPSTRINRWNDNGSVYIESMFKFILVDEVQSWINPPQASMGWSLGLNYNTNTSLRHEEFWPWDSEFPITTDNIDGYISFNFRDSLVEYAQFNISESEEWYNGEYRPAMVINAGFDIQYIGSQNNLNTLNTMIPLSVVPEPATLAILGLGGIFLRRVK
jgi:hypothetical protein